MNEQKFVHLNSKIIFFSPNPRISRIRAEITKYM